MYCVENSGSYVGKTAGRVVVRNALLFKTKKFEKLLRHRELLSNSCYRINLDLPGNSAVVRYKKL